jgi:hypothetical protein
VVLHRLGSLESEVGQRPDPNFQLVHLGVGKRGRTSCVLQWNNKGQEWYLGSQVEHHHFQGNW